MDLTQLAQTTRKAIVMIIFGLIAVIILRVLFNLVFGFIQNVTPKKAVPANQIFGTLEPIKFPATLPTTNKFTFTLETVDAKLPKGQDLMNVYKINRLPTLFMSLETAKKIAANFSFRHDPEELTANKYQFTATEQPGLKLIIDIANGSINMKFNVNSNPTLLQNKLYMDKNEAENKARQYLKNHQVLPTAFEKGSAVVKFLRITPLVVSDVTSADQANGFRVDIFPEDFDSKYPILTQNPFVSPVNITFLASGTGIEAIYEINSQELDIDKDTIGTYNLKTPTGAWQEFTKGEGIVLKNPSPKKEIAIHNISLGYFLEDKSLYLKPVYIFEGSSSVDLLEPDFTGILPAITP